MYPRRSHTLAPLTKIVSNKRNLKLTKTEQDDFCGIDKIVARDALLAYPNFNETFKILTDARNFQLGEVISQKFKLISFYSIKLTDAQKK